MALSDTDIPAPLELHRDTVQPEWVDYNGHMNVAFYVLAFDHATDKALDYLGLDHAYRDRTNCSTFTLELHVNYLREVHEGDALSFKSYVLGVDHKRLHLFHEMYHETTGELSATNENMLIHIDMNVRRSAPYPDDIQAWMAKVAEAHAALPLPPQAGRAISMPGKS